MTPKEKAKELVLQFQDIGLIVNSEAKQCALIAVDEILGYIERMNYTFNLHLSSKDWQEVKNEIKKL